MAATIKDIAKIAGVDHSTVSRGLNDKPGLSDNMRKKIKQIANEIGFEFNANARSLSTARTGTIGIIYDEENYESTLHIYSMGLLRHMRQYLEQKNLDAIITFSSNLFSGEDNIKKLINKQKVDGFIILTSKINEKTIDLLNSKQFPFIIAHQIPNTNFNANSVYSDHFKGGYLAGKHLIEQGCKNLLCITRKDKDRQFVLRTEGFLKALDENGINPTSKTILQGGYSFKEGYQTVMDNCNLIKKTDGIFVHTDLKAIGVFSALKELGISIPNEIALVAYDNTELCTFLTPALSSVSQPGEEISLISCEKLIELINGVKNDKITNIVLPPTLVIRESSCRTS